MTKQALEKVYRDLSAGRLSRQEAFEKVMALRHPGEPADALLVALPTWHRLDAASAASAWSQHHVLTIGLPSSSVEALHSRWPQARVQALPSVEGDLGTRYTAAALSCFDYVQALLRSAPEGEVLVQVVVGEIASAPVYAGLSGLLKTVSLENPQVRGQVVLGVTAEACVTQVASALSHAGESLVRVSGSGLEAQGWEEVPVSMPEADAPPVFKEHGVYLITGGLGGLGVVFAEEILRSTTRGRVVLSGRGEATGERAERLETLRALGGERVSYRAVDLEDAASVSSLVSWVRDMQGGLDGVLHAAGMVSDAFVVKKDAATFAQVLAPKVRGTQHLLSALESVDIDFVALFSSVAGAFGNVGQADYAAANGFLDGVAGGRVVSVNWPLWATGGMALSPERAAELRRTTGVVGMSTASGSQALRRALSRGWSRSVVLAGEVGKLRSMVATGLLGAAPSPTAAVAPEATDAASPTLDEETLRGRLQDWLRRRFGSVLKLSWQRIDVRASLEQYGIDSILAMQLTGELEKSFGALSKTLLFEHRSIESLAEHLWSRHASTVRTLLAPKAPPTTVSKAAAAKPAMTPSPVPPSGLRSPAPTGKPQMPAPIEPGRSQPEAAEPIAVVGLSGRYPEAWDIATFWENLKTGRDCIVEVPADRWDWRDYYSADRTQGGHHYSRWGGFIGGVDEFDPQFFNIAPREAKFIDPQERLFLQHAWMAVEDAGYTRSALHGESSTRGQRGYAVGEQVGVYVGVMYSEYQLFGAEASLRGRRMGLAGSFASIANRVSYALDLHGPSMTVDTMCSSSLTAIHLACQDLRAGRTRMAIAGGVNVTIHPNKYLVLSSGQFISSDGHCQSFGEGGDGYIPGEGVGAVVLKRLSDAERDGDRIYGLIRGSALSHGGRTNGYTVPNPQAQTSAIVQALADAGVEARRISYVEAHGTGTKLGDPIEIAALGEAFGRSRADSGVCLIGSAKSNIGHCEAAAGIAGLTKVLLQLQHGEVVPSLHSSKLNPHIDFGQTAFEVNQTLRPWPVEEEAGRRLTRIAGLSSFGAGGSNAHLVVEEYLAPVSAPTATGPVLVVLSARTEAQLRQKARELSAFVRERPDTDLASLAYTLQVGREAMEERLALVVGDAATLVERLSAFADGAEDVEDLHVGQAKRYREVMSLFATDAALQEAVGRWLSEGRLEQVAGLWAKGLEVRWSQLYPARQPRRMSLPAYPFARERHWLEVDVSAPAMATTSVLHPLLQQNLSDLYRQRYRSRFDGREGFTIAGALDGGVLVEMLRAAVARSLGARSDDAVQLQDVTWPGALAVPCTVDVEVTAQDDGTVACAVLEASDDETAEVAVYASAIGALVAAEQSVCDLADVQSRLATADGGETYRGAGEILRRVTIAGQAWSDHALPQPWWDVALQASSLIGDEVAVQAMGVPEICVHAPLPAGGWVWVRATDASDVLSWTLCDEHGTVCVEAFVDIETPARVEDTSERDPVWSLPEGVEVHDLGVGIQSIRMSTQSVDSARNMLTPALCAALAEAFAAVSSRAGLRAVVLEGTDETFAQGGEEACAAMVSSGLVQAITACPVPVLAVCAGDAVDAGWWLASLGDQLVASEEGRYGYGPGTLGLQASQASLMRARHGAAFMRRAARQVLWSGSAWRASGCAFAVVPREQLSSQVTQWTQSLSDKPEEALRLLKAHLTQAQRAAAVPTWPLAGAGEALGAEPQVLQIDGLATAEVLRQFEDALSSMSTTGAYRGVVLWSASTPFDGVIDAESLLALSSRIAGAPVPVVAALSSSAQGAAWAWSLGCDAAVYAEDRHYGVGEDVFADVRLAQDAAWTCPSRLGASAGRELLLCGEPLTGAALSQRSGGAVLAVAADEVLSQAQAVCATLSANGASAVSSWKRERAAWRDEMQSSQPAWMPEAEVAMATPGPLALESTVVKATLQADGVLLVELQDHEAKNMFSPALVSGVREAFAQVPASGCRVVVVTGTGRYFASGGTRESLLAIQSGEAKFTDYAIYGLPLTCEVPVIAAMQGHGIGAGWSLGMHADVVLHAEEGRYVSPYMSYGFTPGAGSTRMLPLWLGADLARESLLGGREYAGRELRERGLQGVHARGEVLKEALSLAASMARRPRSALVALKRQWATGLRDELERTYAQELAMHERTFVGHAQTRALIEAKFERLPVVPAAAAPSRTLDRMPVIAAASATVNAPSLSSVTSTLRRLLANELQMAESEVDADSQFVDLGLDSIIGVTWVRKLNEAYGLEIEATQVYAHPTLAQMARHVHAAVTKAQPVPAEVSSTDPGIAATDAPTTQALSAARVSFATRRPVVARQAVSQRMVVERPVVTTPPAHVASSPALAPAVAAESLSSVTSTLRRLLANELQMAESEVDADSQFVDLGLDSIIGVTWVRKINEAYALEIEATQVYAHPTLSQMARHVHAAVVKAQPTVAADAPAPTPAPQAVDAAQPATLVPMRPRVPKLVRRPSASTRVSTPAVASPALEDEIAVVGMAGQYPQARDLSQYWRNLAEGRDCIAEVPSSRWDIDRYYRPGAAEPGRTNSRWMGALEDYDRFDPLFFNISPKEAELMDPQQRLFLQTSWQAIEDAGYDTQSLSGSRCGVFAGCANGDYQQLSPDPRLTAQGFTGNANSILAGRIAYLLNLQGPCLSIDTACSSSLVAIAHACESLRAGTSDVALAGGVYVMSGPEMLIKTAQAGMLSPDGRCFTFDQRANGFVPGEGVGVVVLKRLSDARRDGDHVYGTVVGWGVNQDGKTNGITAPNPQAQTRLQREVYERFGIDPDRIGLLEAHGTGTKLGDPIEVEALKASFSGYTQREGYCALGSVKSNIGHTLTAAGVAGFQKLMLSLLHRQRPPTIQFERLNEHIGLAGSPFYVNRELRSWDAEAGGRRYAAVSSFGFGGTNAHVVVAESVEPVHAPTPTGPVLVVLSARTESQLRQKARELSAFVRERPDTDLSSLAYTLQVGREAMEERLALVVDDASTLVERLSSFADGAEEVEDLHVGQAKRHREVMTLFATDAALQEAVGRWLSEGRLDQVAGLWAKGLEVRWAQLYPTRSPRRMSLPTYPFARERHWLEVDVSAPAMATTASVLHPLLQQNLSDLYRQRYRSRFDGREAFAIDGCLDGGVLVEMLRAAVARSLGARSDDAVQLQDVTWPGALPVPCTVDVEVTAQDDGTVHCVVVDASDDDAAEVAVHASAIGALVAVERLQCELSDMQSRLATADGGEMYRGAGEALHRVTLAGNAWSEHALPQPWWDVALLASSSIDGDGVVEVVAVPEVCVHAPLPATGWVWVRATDASDVLSWTLCDEHGTVCVEAFVQTGQPTSAVSSADATVVDHQSRTVERTSIEGAGIASMPAAVEPVVSLLPPLRIAVASASAVEHAATADAVPPVTLQDESSPVESFTPSRAKPTGIALVGLDRWVPAGDLHASVATQRPRFALSVPTAWSGEAQAVTLSSRLAIATTSSTPAETAGTVEVHDLGEGVHAILMSTQSVDGGRNVLTPALCAALAEAFATVSARAGLRAVVLEGTDETFAQGGAEACEAMLSSGLVQAIAACPVPVLAACAGDAVDAGWWLASLGDQLVASEEGCYGYGPGTLGLQASQASLMRARHGAAFMGRAARQAPWSGSAWRASGCAFAVVPREQMASQVAQWTQSLSDKPEEALRLLKAHLTQAQRAAALPTWPLAGAGEGLGAEPQVLQVDGCAAADVLRQFEDALSSMAATGAYRGVVLWSASTPFDEQSDAESLLALSSRIADAPVPVVAALSSSAQGAAWAWSLGCDAAVYAEDGRYGAGEDLFADARLAQQAAWAWPARLGVSLGRELLLGSETLTGEALSQRSGGAVLAVAADDVLSQAQSVCAALSANGSAAVSSWKRERAAWREAALSSQPAWTPEAEVAMAVPGPLALASAVVRATLQADGVLLVELQDHEAKNMFSPALVSGVREAFAQVPESGCRVVVVTGTGRYFASGGTRESLLAIQSGEAKFTDYAIYGLPLQCEVPVVAAMQGHGIGAGWSLGMHADVVLHAEEGRYVSPYMSYGFTPGAGSTRMLPLWLGSDLARESLLGGREYAGRELRERGLQGVHARDRVLTEALSLAASMARRPRSALVALKAQWATGLRDELARTYAQELAMHERTFVGRAQTRALIEDKFRRDDAAKHAAEQRHAGDIGQRSIGTVSSVHVEATSVEAGSTVEQRLRATLDAELHLQGHRIDPDEQFIRIGLDSISAVTWMRRINQEFGTAFEATTLYSYPTLRELTAFLKAHVTPAAAGIPDAAVAAAAPASSAPAAMPVRMPKRPPTEPRQALRAAVQPAPAIAAAAVDASQSILTRLRATLDAELHLQGRKIDQDEQFIQVGLDSISAVTWMRRINQEFGTAFEATTLYSYPTLRELADFLKSHVKVESAPTNEIVLEPVVAVGTPSSPAAPPSIPRTMPARAVGVAAMRARRPGNERIVETPVASPVEKQQDDHRIAIVGMSGRYPQADGLEAFWDNLLQGRDSIVEVPSSRWHADSYYDPDPNRKDRMVSKWLGAMSDIDCFDPLFFRISPEEAEYMDPQHRLFLEESYRAFEDAGYAGRSLSNARCGVYLGISTSEYAQILAQHGVRAAPVTGNSYSIAAARIAYYLNLKGPAISVDTACSSSLVALHLACQALRSGEIEMALAGGVSLWLVPESYLALSQAGMLSPDGRCKAFDDSANGIVMGDGVGALVLKRLHDAEADGDVIHGVIIGSGTNQDGRTNGITAPSVVSQIELERSVHAKFGIDPATIGYVETHGTGTKLGDPIELEALATVFREKTDRKHYCALGSLKSNIGHASSAAGVAAMQKVLLSMRHRTLAPTLHVSKENSHFDFSKSPFFANRTAKAWSGIDGAPLRACVNSFGYSGTNAHVIVEAYAPPAEASADGREHAIPLSARTQEQLRSKVDDLLAAITSEPVPSIAAIAWTLQTGRDAMEHRVGFLASTIAELERHLRAWLSGDMDAVVPASKTPAANDDARSTLAFWLSGEDVEWPRLHGDRRPRRVSLPTYPFARERYWIGMQADVDDETASEIGEGSLEWIEDILTRVESDRIAHDEAVALLKQWV